MNLIEQTYRGKNVLVTGHTGFKGSWLCAWLKLAGANVYGLSDRIPTKPSHFKALGDNWMDHVEADICNQQAIDQRINTVKPDFIFHLAAQAIVSSSLLNPIEALQTNAMGTAHILDALRRSGHPCVVVFITSDKCYENIETYYGYKETDTLGGKDPYSASKAAAECIIHAYCHSFFNQGDINVASVRAGNVIGGGDWAKDRLIPDIIRAWNDKHTIECRKPDATRPWQHVLEPLSGYLLLGHFLNKKQFKGESFNFGPKSENVHSVKQVIESLKQHFDNLNVNYKENPEIHDANLLKLNCDKALAQLHWHPILNYEETIEMTATWYKEFYSNNKDIYQLSISQIQRYSELAQSRGAIWA